MVGQSATYGTCNASLGRKTNLRGAVPGVHWAAGAEFIAASFRVGPFLNSVNFIGLRFPICWFINAIYPWALFQFNCGLLLFHVNNLKTRIGVTEATENVKPLYVYTLRSVHQVSGFILPTLPVTPSGQLVDFIVTDGFLSQLMDF